MLRPDRGSDRNIAIVGCGPMAIYLLKHLIKGQSPLCIEIFEAHDQPGTGMPYRADMNDDFMLANIFSREIPTITEPLADWLRAQPQAFLQRWQIAPEDISGRDFYPRTLLGAYLQAQLRRLVVVGQEAGHSIRLRPGHPVQDICPDKTGFTVISEVSDRFSHVVIATGHIWDGEQQIDTAKLRSPWPATRLRGLPAGPIGILGSSLSAVDVAVALAHDHGEFSATADGLEWQPKAGHEDLAITMISKNGILPEADFYYPYPYEPLLHLTDKAVQAMIAAQPGNTLQGVFDLLMRELVACDPAYVSGLDMPEPTIEAFGIAYFARRQRLGPFRALRLNLAESRKTIARQQTVPSRYALLRGHEAFELVLPHLTPPEWDRFRAHLLPVFADCYAAVPHLSLDRLAALRAAGVIDIVDCGDDAVFSGDADGGVTVAVNDDTLRFDCMIDARGQKAAGVDALAFNGLVRALQDPKADLAESFELDLQPHFPRGAYCLAMPQVLVKHPFSQGLPNCDALARQVAGHLLALEMPFVSLGSHPPLRNSADRVLAQP